MSGEVPRHRRRSISRWAALCAAALLILAAAWTGFWFFTAGTLRDGFGRWVEARRADGWSIQWRSLAIGGFPFAWEARIGQPRADRIGAAPHWFWQGPAIVTLRYRPWSPRAIGIAAPGTHRLGPDPTANQTTATISAREADGRIELDAAGRPEALSIAIADADIAQDGAAPVHIAALNAIIGAVPPSQATPAPQPPPTARLQANLAGLELPPGTKPVLGRTVGRAALTATLIGKLPPGTPAEALAAWRDAGGTVEIGHLALGWGPLSVTGDGTLALDDGLQPEAALSAHVTGYGETVDALVAAHLVEPRAGFIAKLALGALAKTPANGGPPEIAVPVTIQDRTLYVGPAALFEMPRIDWEIK
jgi:hypothetical protein